MYRHRRAASLLFSAVALLGATQARSGAEDGVARNVLERQQNENGFHVKLYDNQAPPPMNSGRALPLPLETSPRSTLDLGDPLPPNPARTQPAAPLSSDAARLPLDVNQQQRLQQLQLQNKDLDEPQRRQQVQIQQLQFDRENQAQSLHDQIMRDSQGSMRQIR
jgi:hypothetical protein